MRNLVGLVLGVGVTLVMLEACGSEDGKKKAPPGQSGGEGGESTSGGTSGQDGGSAGTSTAGDATTAGGSPGGAGEGSGAAGADGNAGAGMGGEGGSACPVGFGECDGNPDTVCEQSLSLVTSCGSCANACSSTNASVACRDLACAITMCNAGFGDCDGDPDTGCEAAIDTDTNCGECGRDCAAAGSTCTAGSCGPVTLFPSIPYGSDNSGNKGFTFDATSASIFALGFNSYAVRRYPVDGVAGASVVWQPASAATGGTESLLVHAGEVYWSIGGAPATVFKKDVDAAPATNPTQVFFPLFRATFLRVQGNAFYWATGDYQDPSPAPRYGYIYTRAIAAAQNDPGTAIVSVEQGNFGNILNFQTTSDALYWVSNAAGTGVACELRTTPLAGGTPTPVPMAAGAVDSSITHFYGSPSLQAVGKTLYFNRDVGDSSINGIYSFEAGDSAPTQLVIAENVTSLLVDSSSIYFIQQNTTGVFKAPLAGGNAVSIASAGGARLIGQDADSLYLLQSSCCASSLLKIIK